MDCSICIEPFNKIKRKQVTCPYCPTDGTEAPACITCIKTYLMQDDAESPRCPSCRSGWTEDFMTQTFAKTWLLKEYKAHREKVLLDIERARLPEAQEDAVRYRKAQQVLERIRAQMEPFVRQMRELPEVQAENAAHVAYMDVHAVNNRIRKHHRLAILTLREAENRATNVLGVPESIFNRTEWQECMEPLPAIDPAYAPIYTDMPVGDALLAAIQRQTDVLEVLRNNETNALHAYVAAQDVLRNAKKPIQRQIRVLQTQEYKNAIEVHRLVGRVRPATAVGTAVEAKRSQWAFVMKCTMADCEGFVGTNWKCGLCETQFCKDCGEQKIATESDRHICDPDTKSTHQALRKEAKPCPKCAAMISKIDGCDQMWCTQCQTAFSWRTGEIEKLHIHNPHYFQWMRQQPQPQQPQPQQQQPMAEGVCLNLTPDEILEQVLHYAMRRRQAIVMEWARSVRHVRAQHRTHQYFLNDKQDDEWRRQLRVKRLVNEITDDIWKDRLQRGEKVAQKEYAILHILDLYIQAGIDMLRNTLPDNADIPTIVTQLQALRKFCNEELEKLQRRFNNDIPYIENPSTRF